MVVLKYSSGLILVLIVIFAHIENGYCLDENAGTRALIRVYDDCHKTDGGIIQCLKKKAVTFLDRVNRIDVINVTDGLKVLKNEEDTVSGLRDETARVLSESELEQTLPRGLEARDEVLTNLLLERVARFLSSRTIQFTLPKVTPNEISRSFEEARGKQKKMMSMMMMGMAMKMAAMVPIAIAGLYLLAGKALIVSKIALLLASIIGLKKLLSGKQSGGGGGGGGGGWSSGGGSQGWSQGGGGGGSGHGGGWDRRSLDAQNIVYNAHKQ